MLSSRILEKLQTVWSGPYFLALLLSCVGTAQNANKPDTQAKTSFERLAKQADAAESEHRVDDAIKLYNQALRSRPSWEEGWWKLGMVHYQLDRYEDAQVAFR